MDWDDRIKELTVLAECNESEPYEVDQAAICKDADGKFWLLTASGCSCWEGEYDEESYDTLDEVEAALLQSERQYNPTWAGAKAMIAEAREKLSDD